MAGVPNAGKTTLFNALTGAHGHVGNWPGVTVECQVAYARGMPGVKVVDLPGAYSLHGASADERAAGEFLLAGKADACIVAVNLLQPAQGLCLAMILHRAGIPLVIALNRSEALRKRGGEVSAKKLAGMLGVAVMTSDEKGSGLIEEAINVAQAHGICAPVDVEPDFRALYASCDAILQSCWREGEIRRSAAAKLDQLVMHTPLGYFALALCLALMLAIPFVCVAPFSGAVIERLLDVSRSGLRHLLERVGTSGWLVSLLVDGVLAGAGGVAGFLPVLAAFFACMSFLEECGFMTRAALLMDRLLTWAGLSGGSMIPMLMGYGCTAPAAMSARCITNDTIRRRTVLLVPMFACSGRMPVCAMLAGLMPGVTGGLLLAAIDAGNLLAALLTARFLHNGTSAAQEWIFAVPDLHLPEMGAIAAGTLRRCWGFLRRCATTIFLSSVVIWIMSHIGADLRFTGMEDSLLMAVGEWLSPLLAPLGLRRGEIAAALIAGIGAKENIITTLAVLAGEGTAADLITGEAAAGAMMAFVMLYTPCTAALAAVRRETGDWRLAAASAVMQCLIAWSAARIVFVLMGG